MGSEEVVMRRDEPTLHHENLTTKKEAKMTFSTPYKMRKFSEDSNSREESPRNSLLLPPVISNSAKPRSSESPGGSLLVPSVPSSPLSFDGGAASHDHTAAASPSTPPQQTAGIPIPAFMQPLLGLEFVPFVMPSVDEGVEALTDKLLEELDVAGCPTYGHSREEVSPLPASARPLKTLDKSPTSQLMLTDLNDMDHGDADKANPVATLSTGTERTTTRNSHTPNATANSQLDHEPESLSPTSERRRNIFQRRRAHSCGSSLKDSSSETDLKRLALSKSSTPRRRMKLWFRKKKPRKDRNELDGSFSESIVEESETDKLEWLETQQFLLQKHQSILHTVQREAAEMQQQSMEIGQRVQRLQSEISRLQKALEQSQMNLGKELEKFDKTKTNLHKLQQAAIDASLAVTETLQQMKLGPCGSVTPLRSNHHRHRKDSMRGNFAEVELQPAPSPPRQRAATAPTNPEPFMDDVGLDLYTTTTTHSNSNDASSTVSSVSKNSLSLDTLPAANEFVFVDHNLKSILQNLDRLGYNVATDESDRFIATADTKKALKRFQKKYSQYAANDMSWPIQPWYSACGEDVLIWTGDVRHDGLGSDWPVCKARGLVNTSPRSLLEYLMDSSKVKEYNKMSQGREDLYKIQEGIDVLASESAYGIAGDCKIVKAINKPRLIPITIEMISLMHCKPLDEIPGSYMMVYRSVFEDATATGDSTPVIRSEMLLGVVLVRPYNKEHTVCEMTSITHMYSPGVPEMIARRAAPSSAMNMVKDIQSIFKEG